MLRIILTEIGTAIKENKTTVSEKFTEVAVKNIKLGYMITTLNDKAKKKRSHGLFSKIVRITLLILFLGSVSAN